MQQQKGGGGSECDQTTLQTPRSLKKEGEGGILGFKAEILLQPVEVHDEAHIHPEAHGGPYSREGSMKEAAIHEEYTEQIRNLQ